ncbi:MAG: hypothetical protein PHG16_07010 [Lachnospiraceae bacterium]|nr:hypothetical protein [Lachnospiraceae bacterium]
MDQIIEKLSEIEIAASRILDSAANQKKNLDAQQEQRIAAYDREIESATAKKVSELQSALSSRLETELQKLRSDKEHNSASLESYYDKNHDALSTEIYEKIIRK